MEQGLFNITDENEHILIKQYSGRKARMISICNCHGSVGAKVRLFLDDGTNHTSIIENTVIPVGVTLKLDGIKFDTTALSLNIVIEDASGGSAVDTNIILG